MAPRAGGEAAILARCGASEPADGRLGSKGKPMSASWQVTGRKPSFGKTVSHSHRRTSRRWNPNVQRKKFYLASEGRTITLTVSPKGLKTIDKHGIEAVVAQIRARGEKI